MEDVSDEDKGVDKLFQKMLCAAQWGDLRTVKALARQGVDIHGHNQIVLEFACAAGHLNVVKYLVKNGANTKYVIEHDDWVTDAQQVWVLDFLTGADGDPEGIL